MLLSKAIDLTDTVTAAVTSHLPRPLAGPVQLAVSTVTWVPRQVVSHVHGGATRSDDQGDQGDQDRQEAAVTPEQAPPTATGQEPEAHEPEVVLTLDRPAEELEPPIDVVGEALRAETPDQPSPLEDEGHVEVAEEVVYSTSSDDR